VPEDEGVANLSPLKECKEKKEKESKVIGREVLITLVRLPEEEKAKKEEEETMTG
jgi:hypothetical protein